MANTLTKVDQFKGFINSQTIKAQVYNSFKDKEMAGAFLSSMIDLYSGDSYLQKCDPEKVALEAVKAAALHLPIIKSLGYAYVVPFKNIPTFTIGYKGLVQLAQRTGQYKIINADVVYEGELKGFDKLSGIPDISGQRVSDKVVGYFAYFRLLNGHEHVFYMSREDMVKYAERYSPSYNSPSSPWMRALKRIAPKRRPRDRQTRKRRRRHSTQTIFPLTRPLLPPLRSRSRQLWRTRIWRRWRTWPHTRSMWALQTAVSL